MRFLPLFPLKLVVYPGESLNLHIFEARYRELIREVEEGDRRFGIPTFIDERVGEFGCEMELLSVVKEHENGNLDIKTKGIQVIRVIEFLKQVPDKLYSAGIIDELDTFEGNINNLNPRLVKLLKQFHDAIGVKEQVFTNYEELNSYDIAHYVGLDLKDKYHLLSIKSERARQRMLSLHIQDMLKNVKQTEEVRQKVQMNGHFREEIPPEY